MTLRNIKLPEENPFHFIKVRQIFFCLILVSIGIIIQFYLIGNAFGYKLDSKDSNLDPILTILVSILTFILTGAWLFRQCNLAGINLKQLIGKVPNNYQWLPLVGLVIARSMFSIGVFRLSYYPVSFIAPSFVENILNENISHNIFLVGSKTFLPGLYYLLEFLYLFIVLPVFDTFIFQGICLHRWSAKWGSKAAILALCILFGTLTYTNVIGAISLVLLYTLLYLKTRTLIVPIIAAVLNGVCYIFLYLWGFFTIANSAKTVSVLEQFRAEWKMGVVLLVVSTPVLVYFAYKNWHHINEPLPYFTNAAE